MPHSIDNLPERIYNTIMKRSDIKILIILLAVAAVCVLVYFAAASLSPRGSVADIFVDGKLYDRIDLGSVEEPYEFELRTEWGSNTILVEKDAISVCSADCPDKICISQGRLTQQGISIVCMPHRLVIRMEGGDIDA